MKRLALCTFMRHTRTAISHTLTACKPRYSGSRFPVCLRVGGFHCFSHARIPFMSGWWNTAEIVLFEISNSLKPYPSFVRAYIGKSRPVIGFSEQKKLIEVSNRIPPTSHLGGAVR